MMEQFGNMMEMIKKVQQSVSNIDEQLQNERVEVNSGDVVKIILNGQQSILAIELNPKYMTADNAALIQDLLVTTINNGLIKSRELHQTAMSKLAGDLNLPKIPGLF